MHALGDDLVVLVREDGKHGGSEVKHVEEDINLMFTYLLPYSIFSSLYFLYTNNRTF